LPTDTYLGAKLQQKLINGKKYWIMTSVDYLNAEIKTIETILKKTQWKLPIKVTTPMVIDYPPELDGTSELDAEETQYF